MFVYVFLLDVPTLIKGNSDAKFKKTAVVSPCFSTDWGLHPQAEYIMRPTPPVPYDEKLANTSCAVPRSAGPQRHGGGSGRRPYR